jgi:hypothetical protein
MRELSELDVEHGRYDRRKLREAAMEFAAAVVAEPPPGRWLLRNPST